MAECYHCGAYIPKGQSHRREVGTGRSDRTHYGKNRVSYSNETRKGIRSLCANCAYAQDEKNRQEAESQKLMLYAFGAVALVIFILFLISRTGR